jgi:hypothetical protein
MAAERRKHPDTQLNIFPRFTLKLIEFSRNRTMRQKFAVYGHGTCFLCCNRGLASPTPAGAASFSPAGVSC